MIVPVALKLPFWNGPPIFLPHLGFQESKKMGETWSGEKTPSGPQGEGIVQLQSENKLGFLYFREGGERGEGAKT